MGCGMIERCKKEKCLAGGDIETAERMAHTVKGAATGIGETALYDAALNLEKAIFDKRPDMDSCFESFRIELEKALEAVSEFLAMEQKL